MCASSLPIINLSPEEQRAIADGASAVSRLKLAREPEDYIQEAQLQAATLPRALRRELLRFRRFGNASGGLVLRGVPLGEIPPTPTHADLAVGTTLWATAAMSVAVAGLGDQYGFLPELAGYPVQDILPVSGFEETQQSIGATVVLKTHVEMAFLPERCDYVVLLCVRQDRERIAGTTLSSVERILPLLDSATIETLREPRFRTTVDGSFLRGEGIEGPIWIDSISALSGPPKRPRLRVDFAETEGKDPEAQEALDRLDWAAHEVAIETRLAPGDLIVVDNHRAFHGRTPFKPHYDGLDRWLLRTFIAKDLSLSEAVRPADRRIVAPNYAAVAEMQLRAA